MPSNLSFSSPLMSASFRSFVRGVTATSAEEAALVGVRGGVRSAASRLLTSAAFAASRMISSFRALSLISARSRCSAVPLDPFTSMMKSSLLTSLPGMSMFQSLTSPPSVISRTMRLSSSVLMRSPTSRPAVFSTVTCHCSVVACTCSCRGFGAALPISGVALSVRELSRVSKEFSRDTNERRCPDDMLVLRHEHSRTHAARSPATTATKATILRIGPVRSGPGST
mmetsp:Transcript_60979/g.157245  ORF Transcript_60979/g.157245 Transcript_60979/m.157245 type:complete len:226 (+) Transcript_60979:812-1489(+)